MTDRKRPYAYEGLNTDTETTFQQFRVGPKRYKVTIAQEHRPAKIVDVKPGQMPSPDILDVRAEDVRAQTMLAAPMVYAPLVGTIAVVGGIAFWWMRRTI